MKKLLLILFIILNSSVSGQVTGKAFLLGQTDHSGIKITCIPHSGTAQLDSTFTDSKGSFSVGLRPGVYKVMYSKSGYQTGYYNFGNLFTLSEEFVLDNITLLTGNAKSVAGIVSGAWNKDTIYVINGDVTIPSDSSLDIAPGTIIKFNGSYSINALGILNAKGSDSLKILFTSNLIPRAGDWNQITLNNSSSIIENCIIEYCTNGLNFSNCSPIISHNEIRNFTIGGIYGSSGSPSISNNKIHRFYGQEFSWGIWIEGSSLASIECNTIFDGSGYGIMTNSDNLVKNNIIRNIKYNTTRGYGINVGNHGKSKIINNFIDSCRIGIGVSSSISPGPRPHIINNTVSNNTDIGLYLYNFYANGIITNNIIVNNRFGIQQDIPNCTICSTTPDTVANNLVWNNKIDFSGVKIVGLGELLTKNTNADSIDSYYNLSQDPTFIENIPPALSQNSPCINAGNKVYSPNIGYQVTSDCQTITTSNQDNNRGVSTTLEFYPIPFHATTQAVVKDFYESAELIIYNMLGKKVRHYQISSQTVIISRDGLEDGVYFYLLTTNKGIVLTGKLIVQ